MRAALPLAVVLCAALAGADARAQTGPVIVVPGKAGVATTINGVIVDGAVVYGDWGLARPGHGEIVIEGPVGFTDNWDSRGYFPSAGRPPRYGRLEIAPPRRRASEHRLLSRLVRRLRHAGARHRISAVRSAAGDPCSARAPVNEPRPRHHRAQIRGASLTSRRLRLRSRVCKQGSVKQCPDVPSISSPPRPLPPRRACSRSAMPPPAATAAAVRTATRRRSRTTRRPSSTAIRMRRLPPTRRAAVAAPTAIAPRRCMS